MDIVKTSTETDLVRDWLAQRAPNTRTAYAGDLARFAEHGGTTPAAAVGALIASGPRGAAGAVIEYRRAMLERGLSPATVNRALAALRSVIALAKAFGTVDWDLDVAGVKARAYRDTRGPKREAVVAMVAATADAKVPARDAAVMKLLYGMALRRGEVEALNVEHLDLAAGVLMVRGKGYADRAPVTVPKAVCAALRDWLAVHPAPEPGAPLFVAVDRAHAGARLTGRSIARIVEATCLASGERRVSPHALRHSAITAALDATNGDVRAVARFSRHANIATVSIYDDNRRDGAGAIAELVAI